MASSLNTILNSPGVAIREIDVSGTTTTNAGTNVFLAGFTPQGISDEPTVVSSVTEFEQLFGLPQTAAEKYTYNAITQLLNTSNASVLFTRMPYGSGAGIGYSDSVNALVFPVIGVSAVEVNPCDYFRSIDEESCRVNFPCLYTSYFVNPSICYGSSNLNCPLNSSNEQAGYLYIHDHPVQYDSIVTGFKFVVDSDSSPEDLKIFQLRPTVNGLNTDYSVVTSFSLSSIYANMDEDQSNLSNDGKRLVVDLTNTSFARTYNVTNGLLSGQTLSGVYVSAGDVFGTYSQASNPTLKYFNASSDVAGSYQTSVTILSSLTVGTTVSVATTAKDATNLDFLISFCGVPVEAGLSCQTITALNLQVPESDRYNFYPVAGDAQLNDANFYVLGEPVSKTLNASEYNLLQNEQFNWKCGAYENVNASLDIANNDVRAGIVVINTAKTAQLEDFSGYYLALNDNLNVNPSTDFNSITSIAGYYQEVCPGVSGDWIHVPSERWNFQTSQLFNGAAGSISEIVENGGGVDFGTKNYNDSLIVTLFKLRPTQLTETINKLDQIKVEQFTGSLNGDRKVNDAYGGPPRSYFLENSVSKSNYLKVMVNPYLAKNNCWTDATGTPQKTVRMFRDMTGGVFNNFDAQAQLRAYGDNLYGVGSYNGYCRDSLYTLCQKKDIGNLPAKLERALTNIENPLEFPIDITIDNGLSTIWATRASVSNDNCITNTSVCYNYDDSYFVDTESLSPYDGTSMNSPLIDAWTTVYNIFDSFARFTRKANGGVGHLHIQDPLRQIFVNGKDYKVVNRQKGLLLDPTTGQPTDKYASFSRNIWAPLRNLFAGTDSNYSESHANWIKGYDANTDSYTWFGPSAFKAALYARNDKNQYPWTAALGTQNGAIANVVDLAINPNQREMDLITKIGINPILKFPNTGYLVYNTLTLQKEPSALQENYIRRGLLWLANSLQANLREFIGQPNTIITRTRVKNKLNPILQFMKDNAGLYGYDIVVDERNNTSESIDQGVMNVAVYVQPTRTIKMIIADIVVNRTGVTLNEIF